jgi:hypothetical protein
MWSSGGEAGSAARTRASSGSASASLPARSRSLARIHSAMGASAGARFSHSPAAWKSPLR